MRQPGSTRLPAGPPDRPKPPKRPPAARPTAEPGPTLARFAIGASLRSRNSLPRVLRRGLRVRPSCSVRCAVAGRILLSRRSARRVGLGSGAAPVVLGRRAGPGGRVLALRVGMRSRRALRRRRSVRVVVELSALDSLGRSGRVERKVTLEPERSERGRILDGVSTVAEPDSLLEGLNDPQREAVLHSEGPLLILAGAGSGKTRVLTHRIAHLVGTGQAQPGEILAITFTNKAANEMRERVGSLVGRRSRAMWVMTFHSACARILRAEAERLGYTRSFTIYDEADSVRLVKNCIEELDIDPKRFPPRGIKRQISDAKNQLLDAEAYRLKVDSFFEQTAADVYELYEPRLHSGNAMDFDDLLFRSVNLFELFPEVRDRYRNSFRHVLVDEYQDTNRAQYRWLQLLGRGAPQPVRGGRRRPVDLPLPRRRHPQHPRLPGPLPRRPHGQAGAELPLDADHPVGRQRGDRPQPRPDGEGAVERPGRGRPGPRARAGGRAGRGALRGRPRSSATWRRAARATTWPSSTGPTRQSRVHGGPSCASARPPTR